MTERNETPVGVNEVTYPSLKLKSRLMHKMKIRGINAALLSAVFLGLAPVFGKAAMGADKFSPFAVVALRTSIAALLLVLILALVNRRALYIYPAALYITALAGAINGFGSIFYYIGLSRLNASVAQLLYSLYPFFVAFWLQLDRQPPTRLTIARIGIAIVAVFFLTRGTTGVIDPLGVLFMLVAAAFFGLLTILLAGSLPAARARAAALVLGLTVVLAIGASRVVLNVHYVSDVAGGFALGAAWLAACLLAADALRRRHRRSARFRHEPVSHA